MSPATAQDPHQRCLGLYFPRARLLKPTIGVCAASRAKDRTETVVSVFLTVEKYSMRRWIIKMVDALDMRGGTPASVFVSLLLLATAGVLCQWGGSVTKLLAPGSIMYRFNAGFFLAAYAMGGRSTARFAWLRFRDGRRFFEPAVHWSDRWAQNLLALGLVVMAIIGVVAWLVGWNGDRTGTAYGAGTFVCVARYSWSVGRYLELH